MKKTHFKKLKTPESEKGGMVFQFDAYFTVLFIVVILFLVQIIMVVGKHTEMQGMLKNIQATVSTNGRKIMNVDPNKYDIPINVEHTPGGEVAKIVFTELEKNQFDGVAEVTYYEYWHDPSDSDISTDNFSEVDYIQSTGSGYYTKAFNYGAPINEPKYKIYESPNNKPAKNKTKISAFKNTVTKTIKHSDFNNTDNTKKKKENKPTTTPTKTASTIRDTHKSQYYSKMNEKTGMGFFNLGLNEKDLDKDVADSTRIAVVQVKLYGREPLLFTNPFEDNPGSLIGNKITTDDNKVYELEPDFENGKNRLNVPIVVEKTWVLNSFAVADKAWRPYLPNDTINSNKTEEKAAEEWYAWISKDGKTLNITTKKPNKQDTYMGEISKSNIRRLRPDKIQANVPNDIMRNIKKINCPEKVLMPEDMSYTFEHCFKLEDAKDAKNFDVSRTKQFARIFRNCKNLKYVDVSTWNTKNAITFNSAFANCSSLITINVSDFDTSNVINMSGMFNNCLKLKAIDVSKWNTSKACDMNHMFCACKNLTYLDVSKWDVSNVGDIRGMFNGCTSLTSLDVSNWNTSSVAYTSNTFQNCVKLEEIDVSKWDTSQVNAAYWMFDGCTNLKTLDVSNWFPKSKSSIWGLQGMFSNCKSLTELDVSNWDTSHCLWMQNTFYGCTNLKSIDVSKWNTKGFRSTQAMFCGCTNLERLDLSGWNTQRNEHMENMFNGCENLKEIAGIGNLNTSQVDYMHGMFKNCKSLTNLDISNWNTSKVRNMNNMFKNCKNLTGINIENWNTSSLKDKENMFENCKQKIIPSWYKK